MSYLLPGVLVKGSQTCEKHVGVWRNRSATSTAVRDREEAVGEFEWRGRLERWE